MAATATQTALNDLTGGFSIYEGLRRGGPYGTAAAASSGLKLGADLGAFGEYGSMAKGIGAGAGNVLGIVGGLQQGGVAGDVGAAINAAELGARTGAFGAASGEVGAIAGEAVVPLSVYQFAKNWRSGSTGADALAGAESGAAIGSLAGPVGSLIGMGIGAAVGAVSSIFGPGRKDPETIGWDQYAKAYQTHGAQGVMGATPSQNFQMLAGIFDARGSQIPFYQRYGRMGETRFMNDMAQKINQGIASGVVPKNATPQQIYAKVVEPWINSMSPGGWKNTSTIQGAPEKQAIGNLLTNLIGDYTSGQINAATPVGIKGQTIAGLQPYHGTPTAPNMGMGAAAAQSPTQQAVNTAGQTSMLPTLLAAGGAAGLTSTTGAGMPTRPNYQTNDPASVTAMGAAGVMPGVGGGYGGYGTPGTGGSVGGGYGTAGLSPLATTGILGGLGLGGALYAQHQNTNAIAPLSGAATPYLGAGQQLLQRGMTNQLTPQQSQVVNTAQQQGKTIVQAATPLGQIAQQNFSQYQSGNLKPGDQAQLDQQIAAAKAQIAQQFGPNVDSTTLQTYYDQIDQQAQITKGEMLKQYFSTGNQAFDTWSQTTQAGQAAILAGQEYAVTSIDNNFNKAYGAGSIGGQLISDAVHTAISSNNQLGQSFGNYMSNLAKAFALSKYGQSGGGGGGYGGAPGSFDSQVMNQETSALNQAVGSDINATSRAIGMTYAESQQDPFNTSMFNTPGGSVSVGQPGDYTDVMGNTNFGGGDYAANLGI